MSIDSIQQSVTCPDCNGKGRVIKDKDKCAICKGKKVNQEKKSFEVLIDKGVPDSYRYLFANESNEYSDCILDNLIAEIQIEPNKKFLRKGTDHVFKMETNLLETLCGFEKIIEHLKGRKTKIKSKKNEVIKPESIKQLRNLICRFSNLPINIVICLCCLMLSLMIKLV